MTKAVRLVGLALLALAAAVVLPSTAPATDFYTVPSTVTSTISEWGACRRVYNGHASGKSLMVPTKYQYEWLGAGSFNSATIAGVKTSGCIGGAVRFRAANSNYFSKTPASNGSTTKLTWSGWVKRGNFGAYQRIFNAGAGFDTFLFTTTDTLIFWLNGQADAYLQPNWVFRDSSAWYHIVLAIDTTQATPTDRVKIYINGRLIPPSAFTLNNTYPAQNYNMGYYNKSGVQHNLGCYSSGSQPLDGYMADVYFIDGQQLTPTSFAGYDSNGMWVPVAYGGSYGTNGYHLEFTDPSNLGKDSAGSNNWTANNFSTAGTTNDVMQDNPTLTDNGDNGQGNYATLNPLTNSGGTFSNANLRYVGPGAWRRINGTIAVSSGKWYYEGKIANAPYSPRGSTTLYNAVGFGLATVTHDTNTPRLQTDSVVMQDSGYFKNFSGAQTDSGATLANGDTIGVAVDLDNNQFTFYRNNSSIASGTIGAAAGTLLVPVLYGYSNSYGVFDLNFGQQPFSYSPPTGFKALNTRNLGTPTIADASAYFQTALYTGNGGTQSVYTNNGTTFQPDLVIVKDRSATRNWTWVDSVRGATKEIWSDLSNVESTNANGVSSINSNGFTVGNSAWVNSSGENFVAYMFKKGATSGLDIVTFTAPASGNFTVPHSLGVAPAMVIVKARNLFAGWWLWHQSLANNTTAYVQLNSTAAATTYSTMWGTGNTSTNLGMTAGGACPANYQCVAYAFAEVPGFSKFGSYTGNGSADGPFVYTGFKPAFVMLKDITQAQRWYIHDNAREPTNQMGSELSPGLNYAEGNLGAQIDFLSNGFKLRDSGNANTSGDTIIYAAFAEQPFKYTRAK